MATYTNDTDTLAGIPWPGKPSGRLAVTQTGGGSQPTAMDGPAMWD